MDQPSLFSSPEARVAAFLAHDKSANGHFIIGVKTTKIFCHPGCGARPLLKNITFYDNREAAIAAGLRACLRCRP